MNDAQKKPLLPTPPPYPYCSWDRDGLVYITVLGDGRLSLRVASGEVTTLALDESKRLACSILAPFL
jgi:hypothetical protein